MTDSHSLTESHIHRWIDERSFERGRRYFQHDHILNPRRQGDTLKARCMGSRPHIYQEIQPKFLREFQEHARGKERWDGGLASGRVVRYTGL